MVVANFDAGLALVWQPGFDDPADGYHVTPGDPAKGTYGGVTEAVWQAAVKDRLVKGELRNATRDDLKLILEVDFWGAICDALPPGVDVLFFNGRMMTGDFPHLFQQCLGFIGAEVDGNVGPETIADAYTAHAPTLINAVTGVHAGYLSTLPTWRRFRDGWTKRLLAAQEIALKLATDPKEVALDAPAPPQT